MYWFEIPKRNRVLGILVGDNHAAKIHEMMLRPEDNPKRRAVSRERTEHLASGIQMHLNFDYTFFLRSTFGLVEQLIWCIPVNRRRWSFIEKDFRCPRHGFYGNNWGG